MAAVPLTEPPVCHLYTGAVLPLGALVGMQMVTHTEFLDSRLHSCSALCDSSLQWKSTGHPPPHPHPTPCVYVLLQYPPYASSHAIQERQQYHRHISVFLAFLMLSESHLLGHCEGCSEQAVHDPHEARGV